MSSLIVRKPHYGIDEVCRRWGISEADLAGFVIERELTLSVVVAGITVEVGSIEVLDERDWHRIPEGRRTLTGAVDLRHWDAWHALTEGTRSIRGFLAEGDRYVDVASQDDEDGVYVVTRDRLIVRRGELERFEAAQAQLQSQANGAGAPAEVVVAMAAAPRGPVPQYEWDAFWREVARIMLFEGPPESLAALVRRMEAWFAERPKQPDTSTIKKKLSPLWRMVVGEAERGPVVAQAAACARPAEKARASGR
ncbi:MAG TPA: hypothetical protein VE571_14045 [Solirubrobacteraceae bacterium]|nr:hypothetical protein [Solirubrobacteraceae bacterium]